MPVLNVSELNVVTAVLGEQFFPSGWPIPLVLIDSPV
jgi:hypothetical protein